MTNWARRTQAIQVGDTVGYSKRFLQSTSQYTGDVPLARGKVAAIHALGEMLLAQVEWDRPNLPDRVNVKNLSTIREIALGE